MDWNIILGIVGVVLGIIGLIAGYIFYRRGLRTKEPCWSMKTETLIEGYSAKFQDLKILYQDKQIENLSVSRIAFWNRGRETIEFDDIPQKAPPLIVARGEAEILDAKVIQQTNRSSDFSVHLSDNGKYAQILFDYIDNEQGAVFQVIHTGTSPIDIEDLQVWGDIKGAKRISFKTTYTTPLVGWIMAGFSTFILWFFTISYIVVGFLKGFQTIPLPGVFYVIIFVTVGFTVIIAFQVIKEAEYHAKVPKGLESFA
jgi:hypothetical protein